MLLVRGDSKWKEKCWDVGRMSQSWSKPILYPLFVFSPSSQVCTGQSFPSFCRLSFDIPSYLVYKDPEMWNFLSFSFRIMVTQFQERVGKTILWERLGYSEIPSPNTTLARGGIVWKLIPCSPCNLFLLCSQITLEKNGYWKWLFCDWIHSVGINKAARSPTPSILPVPRNVYGHGAGKFGIDNPNCTEFTPTHPHVLFPV